MGSSLAYIQGLTILLTRIILYPRWIMEWELAELWNKGALQFDEFCETVILSSSHIPSFAFTFLMKAVQGIATYIQVLLIGICTQKYILASGDVLLSCWQGP